MRKVWISILLLAVLALSACASEPLYDLDADTEVIELNVVEFRSEPISEEEKESQYQEYLINMCQEALKKLDGIEDISLDFGDGAEDLKVKVELALEEAVGDKDALKENIEKILKGFFSEMEGAVIEFTEKEAQ